jgi:hypothetical protein
VGALRKLALAVATLWLLAPSCAQAGEATYADVMSRPDDVATNLSYVRRLVAEGRLDAAATTLERLLVSYPDAADIRYAYMLVLYRLADYAGAREQIAMLRGYQLPANVAADIDSTEVSIAAAEKTTRYDLSLATGLRWDSNRNLASSAATGLLLGSVVPNLDSGQSDFAVLGDATFSVEHDLNAERTLTAFAAVGLSGLEQFEMSDYDYQAAALEAGFEFTNEPWKVRISAIARGFRLDTQNFGYEAGARAKLTLAVTEHVSAFADVEAIQQGFRSIPISVGADLHDGPKLRLGGGVVTSFTDRTQVVVAAHGSVKSADVDQYDFDAFDAEFGLLQLFSAGQYVRLDASLWRTNWGGPDPVYSSSVTRRDTGWRGRIAYGVPIATLVGLAGATTPEALAPITLQLAADYIRQDSNIPNFDYSSYGFESLLIYRKSF